MTEAAAASGPPVTADPQDPLPDPNWFYRRLFVFVTTAVLLALLWIKIDIVGDVARNGSETAIGGLIDLLKRVLSIVGFLILCYMVAPSAEQITKMIATASAWKKGVSTSSTSRATGPGGTAESTTTVSPAPATPAAPAVPVAPSDDLPEYAR